MKKAIKIVLYVFGSFLLLVALVLIFHNAIISFALKTAISSKSEGKVTLKIKDFDFNLLNSSISINEPELVMKELYLNETKSILLDRVVFNKIEIDIFDLKLLITKRNISANKFLIDKPEFWFSEQGTNAKSSFHPDRLFEALSFNPGLFKKLQVEIGDIEIHYGSINISEHVAKEIDPGVVDFSILLHDFNTAAATDTSHRRVLFSEELLFKLKNLNRKLKSGYTVKLDSAIFSTKKRDLEIGGAAFIPGVENMEFNAIGVYAGQLRLTDIGIEEVRGLEDLSLGAVHVSDGHFTSYLNGQAAEKNTSDNSATLESLQKLFYEFILDSITISRFEYYNIDKNADTTIAADDINFLITGIEIDSGMFDDPFRNFLYDTIKLSTGNLELDNLIPGFEIKYRDLSYSNFDRNLTISGISVNNDSSANNLDKIDIALRVLDIKGFSLKRFQKQQIQRLSITINNPEVDLNLTQLAENRKKTANGEPFVPKYLQLEKIILLNGNLNLAINNQLEVALKGLNIDVEEFNFPDQTDTNFRYQNLTFNYDYLIGQIENKRYQFVTGALSYRDQNLMLNNLNGTFSSGNAGQVSEFKSKYLKLEGLDLDRLIFKKELQLSTFQIAEPLVSGTIQIPAKKETSFPSQGGQKSIPLTFNIDTLKVTRGEVDLMLEIKDDELNIFSSYEARLGNLNAVKGDSFQSLFEKLLWDVELKSSNFEYKDHKVFFKLLQTNSFRSDFTIDSLLVNSDLGVDSLSKKLKLRKIEIPFLDVSGLDYKLLLIEDSLKLRALKIADARIDLVLPKVKKKKPVNPNYKIDLRQFLFLSYDSISLTKMHLNIEHPGDTVYAFYGLNEFNFQHVRTEAAGLNLVNNLGFEFKKFSYLDTISGRYINLSEGFVDSKNSGFSVKGIEGGTVEVKKKKLLENSKTVLQFKSSELDLQNVFIKNDLPSAINIGKIYIGELDLEYEKTNGENIEKTPFKLDLGILKRYSKVLSRMLIDTTNLNDISLHYHNQSDTVSQIFKMDNVSLIVNQIDIDTSMAGQSEPQLIDRITIDLRGRTHITKDSLYEIRTGKLYYNFPKHQITIDSLYVTPRYPDSLFFEKAIYQTDRMDLFGRKIEINSIDVDGLINRNHMHFGSIDFHEFDLSMYRDKKHYEIMPGLYKPMPREAIMAINQKFTIDSIHFIDSYLAYKQIEKKSEKPGNIFLSDFNLTAYNITNQLEEGDRESMMKINLDTKIMGESKMDFTFFFPLYPDSTTFWLSGKTEDIDMTKLNSMTENLMGIGITRGVGSVDAELISANDSVATGSLVFRYKKLRLALYNREKEELNSSFVSPIVNFFINDLVLRSNNPRFARKVKVGMVYWKRDTRKGIVNYAFKSLLNGMLSTLGINNKGQKQEKKDLKNKP